MAARKGPHYQMSAAHRDKIKNSNILNALIEHVEGKRDMSSTQVTAGVALLKKVMPDLAHTEHANDPDNPLIRDPKELDDATLAAIAAGSSEGVAETPKGARKPH